MNSHLPLRSITKPTRVTQEIISNKLLAINMVMDVTDSYPDKRYELNYAEEYGGYELAFVDISNGYDYVDVTDRLSGREMCLVLDAILQSYLIGKRDGIG